jgi:hypothetical protein
MSFYNEEGYRVESTARRNAEQKDYDMGFHLNVKGHDVPVVGQDGMFDTREEAEEFAENHIDELHNLAEEDN